MTVHNLTVHNLTVHNGGFETIEMEVPAGTPVANLDRRRRNALEAVDTAKFSIFHVKTVLVTGVGFFTDAYDTFAINLASTMIGFVNPSPGTNGLLANYDLAIKVAVLIGSMIGQVFFGWLGDRVGRKRMYGVTLLIIIFGTFGQALVGQNPAVSIVWTLALWRLITGIGIGGDYPLSAIITSEFAPLRTRGRMMTAVFAMQGLGRLAAACVAAVVVAAFKDSLSNDTKGNAPATDRCWRLLVGLACVPGAIALYYRLSIPETPRYTMDVDRNVQRASNDAQTFFADGTFTSGREGVIQRVQAPRASIRDFMAYFSRGQNFRILFGAAYSWFAIDVAVYGLGLNADTVLQNINLRNANIGAATGIYHSLRNLALGNVVLALAGLIPGYWISFLVIDRWGRTRLQLIGFCVITVILISMGSGFYAMKSSVQGQSAFFFLYCLANFFQNFGANTTTFIIPGESFPTRYRGTAYGICAASGRLGAILAQVLYSQLKDYGGPAGSNNWLGHILQLFAFFTFTGIFSTLLLDETVGLSLEQLSNEAQNGFIQGVAPVHVREGVIELEDSRGPSAVDYGPRV